MNKINILFLSIISTAFIYGVNVKSEVKIAVPKAGSGKIENASVKDLPMEKCFTMRYHPRLQGQELL